MPPSTLTSTLTVDHVRLPGYRAPAPVWLRRSAWTVLVAGALFYGVAWGLFGSGLLLQLAVPLLLLMILCVWLLPDTGRPPARALEWLLFGFLVALLAWPDYLALALPGLPWITAIRLMAVPLAVVMLLCLSVSAAFRRDVMNTLNAQPAIWRLVVAFAVIALLSVGVSRYPTLSINKFVVAQLYWTLIFFAAVAVFWRPRRARWLVYLLWAFALYVCAIAMWEWHVQGLPWADHIPSFLKVEDEAVQRILSAKSRAATGIYRVQAKFTTPLGCAEFLAYAMPFVLHLMATARWWIVRLAAAASVPLIFHVISLTDSRLGMVGFFASLLLYTLAWAVLRWRDVKGSLFGPALTLAYPAVLAGFIAATFFVGRLRALIWGTGAQRFSTESREAQVAAGIPKVFSEPWGHGIGQGAEVLGFRNGAGVLTIDTYYLAVALEFGVVGFVIYYGIFFGGILHGGRAAFRARSRDTLVLIPLTIALINFFIIKSIFSQLENHPLVFALLGATVALIARVRVDSVVNKAPDVAADPIEPTLPVRQPEHAPTH